MPILNTFRTINPEEVHSQNHHSTVHFTYEAVIKTNVSVKTPLFI